MYNNKADSTLIAISTISSTKILTNYMQHIILTNNTASDYAVYIYQPSTNNASTANIYNNIIIDNLKGQYAVFYIVGLLSNDFIRNTFISNCDGYGFMIISFGSYNCYNVK